MGPAAWHYPRGRSTVLQPIPPVGTTFKMMMKPMMMMNRRSNKRSNSQPQRTEVRHGGVSEPTGPTGSRGVVELTEGAEEAAPGLADVLEDLPRRTAPRCEAMPRQLGRGHGLEALL